MPSDGTPGRSQEGRSGQGESLSCNEAAAKASAGVPGAVRPFGVVPGEERVLGICPSALVGHWVLLPHGSGHSLEATSGQYSQRWGGYLAPKGGLWNTQYPLQPARGLWLKHGFQPDAGSRR